MSVSSDWLALAQSQRTNQAEVVPPDFKTSAQLVEILGMNRFSVSTMLRKGVEDGTVELRMFKVSNGRYVRGAPHYRLIGKKGKKK